MADIRAPQWPAVRTPTAPAAKADARAEAQRAFFQAAMAGQTVVTSKVAETAPAAGPRAPDLRVQMPDAPPERYLRPGSILDIKV